MVPLLHLVVPSILFQIASTSIPIPLPKVGIIGAGAGGSSAAYHLSQLLNNNVEIDVFEAASVIGGRMATVNIFGNEYETGASILHPRNKLALDLVERFGLDQRPHSSSSVTSILKDSEFVFSTSSWTILTIYKILLRYGFDFNKLQAMTQEFIDGFENIYELQDKGLSFDTVELMLSAMDPKLLNLTKSEFRTFLEENGYGEGFITELVQAITYVNYGQSTSMHSLVGHISVAGAENGLWSVQSGNKMLAMALLNNSNARIHFNTRIESILAVPSGSAFRLSTDRNGQVALPGTYDKIIMAMPWSEQNPIQFINFLDQESVIEAAAALYRSRSYHRTVATLVAAKGITPKYRKWVDILSCTPNFFTSISRVHPVVLTRSERVPVFKVFSPEPLTDSQLGEIFEEIHQVDVSDWWAYPEYDRIPPPLPSFHVLPNSIYYLNGIEWAASAIEMSLISGRNAAIQVASQYAQTGIPPTKRRKTEL